MQQNCTATLASTDKHCKSPRAVYSTYCFPNLSDFGVLILKYLMGLLSLARRSGESSYRTVPYF